MKNEYHVWEVTIHSVNKNYEISGNTPNKKCVKSTRRKLYSFIEEHKRRLE